MVSGLAPMMALAVVLFISEGIPMMWRAWRKRREWRRIRRAYYPKMYY